MTDKKTSSKTFFKLLFWQKLIRCADQKIKEIEGYYIVIRILGSLHTNNEKSYFLKLLFCNLIRCWDQKIKEINRNGSKVKTLCICIVYLLHLINIFSSLNLLAVCTLLISIGWQTQPMPTLIFLLCTTLRLYSSIIYLYFDAN